MTARLFLTCFLACTFSFVVVGVFAYQVIGFLIKRAIVRNLPEILAQAMRSGPAVDDDSKAALESRLDVLDAESRETISMLHDNSSDGRIGEELEKLGALPVQTRPQLLHDLHVLQSKSACETSESICLSGEIVLLVVRGNSAVQHRPPRSQRNWNLFHYSSAKAVRFGPPRTACITALPASLPFATPRCGWKQAVPGVCTTGTGIKAQGRSLIVAEMGEQKLDLVQDFIDVVTSMCARIYGRRAASNRAKRALAAAEAVP